MKRLSLTQSRVSSAAAILVVVTTAVTAALGVWLFDTSRVSADTSIWQNVLVDRWTIGSLRLAIVALALYVAMSAAVLAATSRWIKAFTTSGFEVDAVKSVDEQLAVTEMKLRAAEQERDEALRLLREYLGG